MPRSLPSSSGLRFLVALAFLIAALLAIDGPTSAATPTLPEMQAVAERYGMTCEGSELPDEPGEGAPHCRRDYDGGPVIPLQVNFFDEGNLDIDALVPPPDDWNDLVTDLAQTICEEPREVVAETVRDFEFTDNSQLAELSGCFLSYYATDVFGPRRWGVRVVNREAAPSPGPSLGAGEGDLADYLVAYGLDCTDSDNRSACQLELTDEAGLDATYSVTRRFDQVGDLIAIDAAVVSLDESMPSDAGTFLRGIAERAPVGDPADLVAWLDSSVDDEGVASYASGDWTASWSDTAVGDGRTWSLSILRPEGQESPEPTAVAAPAPAAPAEPGERPFAASVPKPGEVSTDPIVLLQSAALAALLVFLMPFPSQLFNSTLEAHENEVRRWLRLDRIGSAVGGIGAFWASWPGVAMFTLLAAVLYGFLDPGFGFSLASLATFLGMLVGIVLVTAAFAVPVVLAHRRLGDRWQLKVVPVSLIIGVACVLLSRLTGFQPGYLYGLLIGLAFARELSAADEGRATAIGAVVMLAVALVAWLGLGTLPEGEGFGLVVLRTSLAALMVAGLEGVVFGLLPMRFLPGEPLYAWNRILWGALLAVGAFAFFHILINPASGYLSDSSRTPLFTVLALLIGFSLVSVAFWAWFRFRSGPAAEGPTVT